MSDAVELPLNEDDQHIVDPPIIDFLHFDSARDAFAITFVPDDIVSPREKEMIMVPRQSEDGRRVQLRLRELARIIGQPVDRVFHSGGGNFGFNLRDGSRYELRENAPSAAASQDIYVQLQDLGMIAQIAFREEQLLKR
jgi:hypothetical protein